jgi:hypothetical protein
MGKDRGIRIWMSLYSVVLCLDYMVEEWEGRKGGEGNKCTLLGYQREREVVCIYHYTVLYSALKRVEYRSVLRNMNSS